MQRKKMINKLLLIPRGLMLIPWGVIFLTVMILAVVGGGLAFLGDYLNNYIRTGSFFEEPKSLPID